MHLVLQQSGEKKKKHFKCQSRWQFPDFLKTRVSNILPFFHKCRAPQDTAPRLLYFIKSLLH